ncbi:hypothetical protein [Nocardia asteroides]|uniref:hypothetical protein n=1 Tax=Nocardia asteroides TaxID=1824 RepID=UPI001E46BB7F|nr:hypothetical protein [Nocardia asteroides]UGT63115.1 hypothetical protein LTT61_07265 [Nocardia asteroides]
MNVDDIGTRTRELATRLGIQPPQVQEGPVPAWIAEGVRAVPQPDRTLLVVGPGFGELAPAERDAGLASAMVVAELYRRGKWKPLAAAAVLTVAVGVLAFLLVSPKWLVIPIVVVLFPIGFVLAQALWLRGVAYGHDRRLAEVFGRDTPELLLELNARNEHEIRGVLRAYLAVSNPARSRRRARLRSV